MSNNIETLEFYKAKYIKYKNKYLNVTNKHNMKSVQDAASPPQSGGSLELTSYGLVCLINAGLTTYAVKQLISKVEEFVSRTEGAKVLFCMQCSNKFLSPDIALPDSLENLKEYAKAINLSFLKSMNDLDLYAWPSNSRFNEFDFIKYLPEVSDLDIIKTKDPETGEDIIKFKNPVSGEDIVFDPSNEEHKELIKEIIYLHSLNKQVDLVKAFTEFLSFLEKADTNKLFEFDFSISSQSREQRLFHFDLKIMKAQAEAAAAIEWYPTDKSDGTQAKNADREIGSLLIPVLNTLSKLLNVNAEELLQFTKHKASYLADLLNLIILISPKAIKEPKEGKFTVGNALKTFKETKKAYPLLFLQNNENGISVSEIKLSDYSKETWAEAIGNLMEFLTEAKEKEIPEMIIIEDIFGNDVDDAQVAIAAPFVANKVQRINTLFQNGEVNAPYYMKPTYNQVDGVDPLTEEQITEITSKMQDAFNAFYA